MNIELAITEGIEAKEILESIDTSDWSEENKENLKNAIRSLEMALDEMQKPDDEDDTEE